MTPLIALVATIAEREEHAYACVTALLSCDHVQGVVVGVQGTPSEGYEKRFKLLGGAHDVQVTVLPSTGTNVATARQFLLAVAWTEWVLMVDDDVLVRPDGVKSLWQAREGYEGVSGLVYMNTGEWNDAPSAIYPEGFGSLDRVSLFRADLLRARGGFLPNTETPIDGRVAGEDVLASTRLWLKHLPVLVGTELASTSTWTNPDRYMTRSIHAVFPGE